MKTLFKEDIKRSLITKQEFLLKYRPVKYYEDLRANDKTNKPYLDMVGTTSDTEDNEWLNAIFKQAQSTIISLFSNYFEQSGGFWEVDTNGDFTLDSDGNYIPISPLNYIVVENIRLAIYALTDYMILVDELQLLEAPSFSYGNGSQSFSASLQANSGSQEQVWKLLPSSVKRYIIESGVYSLINGETFEASVYIPDEYVKWELLKPLLNKKVNALNDAIDFDANYFKAVNGKIQVITDNLPANLKFADGSEVDSQATRAEDVVSQEDIALREKIDLNQADIEFLKARDIIQNEEINDIEATNQTQQASIEALAKVIANSGKKFGGRLGSTIINNQELALTITQVNNNYDYLTFTSPNTFIWNDTDESLDLIDQSLVVTANFDASGAGSTVSFRVKDNAGTVVYTATETITDGGSLTLQDSVTLTNGETYTCFVFSSNNVRMTGGSISLLGDQQGGGGASTSSQIIDDSATEPTLGMNPKIIKWDGYETSKADKTYVDEQLELKQDKTDNTLTTNDKTIVGAINEINYNKRLLHSTFSVPLDGTTVSKTTSFENFKEITIVGKGIPQQYSYDLKTIEPSTFIIFRYDKTDGTYAIIEVSQTYVKVRFQNITSSAPSIEIWVVDK